MIKLKCGNVTRLFLCVYLEIMNIQVDDLELKPFRKSSILCCIDYALCSPVHLITYPISNFQRTIYQVGNRKLRTQIELAYKKFKNSKKTIDQFFGCRIVKAMKRRTDEYTIKTKKIDTKTLIIFGDSNKEDEFYYGKDYLNLKSFEPIAIEINVLMKLLGKPKINNLEDEYLNKINIFHLKNVQDRNAQARTVGYRTRYVPAGVHGSINIGVYDWPTTDVYWLPSENLINNSFMCTQTKTCYYTTNRITNLKRHQENCTDVQKIEGRQQQYGCQNDEVLKLSEIMNIDFSRYRQKHHVCFDIETFGKGEVCVPVSIAVASTLDGPKYFEKADDTTEAGYQMVKQFMDYLLELQEKLVKNLEPEIEKAISFLQSEKEQDFNRQRYKSKAEINKLYRYFKNYEVLKIFGFNSRFVSYCTIDHCVKSEQFSILSEMNSCPFCPEWTVVHLSRSTV